jgi:hypothetical protein
MISITSQSTFLIWSIACTLVLLTTKSFKNQLNSKRTCSQIRSIRIKMINISLIVNIVEKNTRIVEMNFAMKINQIINFESFDSRKSALYATSTIVDQSITSKRSEITRKSVSLIVILNTKLIQSTIVVWSSILLILKTLSIIQMTKMRLSISTISALLHQWSTTLS